MKLTNSDTWQRNSAPTGADETVDEMKLGASDPLGVSPCSFSYSWGEMLKFEWRHTPMLKCCLLAAILLPTLAIGIPVTLGHLGYSCRSKESRPPQAESQSQLRSIPNQSLKSSDDVNVLKAP